MPVTPPDNFVPLMSIEEVKAETMLLTPDNIRLYPCSDGRRDDFRSMWNKFGPQAARDIILPAIWYQVTPRPSVVFKHHAEHA